MIAAIHGYTNIFIPLLQYGAIAAKDNLLIQTPNIY
jgi:hypothetical protein